MVLVSKPDIEHGKPLECIDGTSKIVIFAKKSLLKEVKKSIFLFSDMKSWADPQDIMGDYTHQ